MPTTTKPPITDLATSPWHPELVVIGEALMDCIEQSDGTLLPSPGGGPFNTARAAARLGLRVALGTPFSDDVFGQRLQALARADGVRTCLPPSRAPTALALVNIGPGGQPAYRFYREATAVQDWSPQALLDVLLPSPAALVHTGSLMAAPPDAPKLLSVLETLAAAGWTVSVDLNMRAHAWPDLQAYRRQARAVAEHAHWLKVSDEDLQVLGIAGDPVDAAASLLSPRTQAVVLTQGARGAWCLTHAQRLHHCAPEVAVVDTVGAGDCFWAAFLVALRHALASGNSGFKAPADPGALQAALAYGTAAAAFSLTHRGCVPPTRAQLGEPGNPITIET